MRPDRRTFPALFFLPAVLFVGCAADPGDSSKLIDVNLGPMSDGDAGSQMMTMADAGSRYVTVDTGASPPSDDSSVVTPPSADGSIVTPPDEDGSVVNPPGDDAGEPPVVDAGMTAVVDTGPPDAGFTGAGCAPGALVVVIPNSDSSTCGHTGPFAAGTASLGPVCVEFHGAVPGGWNASNATACSITVTGGGATQTVSGATAGSVNQPPMAAGADGFVYWNLSAGCIDYAAISCY